MSDHKSWEVQAVDEIIAAEKRIREIDHELMAIDARFDEGWLSDEGYTHLVQYQEELWSELSDLQKVVGNE